MTTIRPITPDDLETVVVLELEVFASRAWSPRSVEGEFSGLVDTRAMWLVEETDKEGLPRPIGYAVGRYVGDVAELLRVAVLPSRRRHGTGQQLVDRVLAEAARRGCARLLLEVAADNEPARALYRRNGFEPIDRRPRYYPGGVDALILHRGVEASATDD